jgi:competence protein ComEA
MFDALKRTATDGTASARLKQLAAARQNQEWIDETDPEAEPPARPRPFGRRLPAVATAVAAVVAVCAVVGLSVSGPEKEIPPPLPAAAVSTTTQKSSTIVVSVVGRVGKPGLVTLPEGARVAEAIQAVGGASEVDILTVNVARRLTDGEQIYVGIPPPPEAAPAAAKPAKPNLNTATLAELDNLPGVGAVTAQRILDYRTEHGHFTAVEQLRHIDGIGENRYGKLKDLVTIR